MAKRSTIGENPLDAVNQEHPLDTVVPDLSVAARSGRGQPAPELAPEVQERLQELEAGLKALRTRTDGAQSRGGRSGLPQGRHRRIAGGAGRTAP